MLKILVAIFLSVMINSNANAGWWDCKAGVEKKDIYGLLYGWDFDLKTEVSADRRSQAESKAVNSGKYVTKKGFFSNSDIYVCASGQKEYDGKTCKYRFYKAECRRQ